MERTAKVFPSETIRGIATHRKEYPTIRVVLTRPVFPLGLTAILVHGFAGDKEEKGLFPEIANGLSILGIQSLRFDFSGKSFRRPYVDDLKVWEKDLTDVIRFVENEKIAADTSKVIFIGFSLGAALILRVIKKREHYSGFIFLAPAFSPKNDMFPRYDTNEIRVILDETGMLSKNDLSIGARLIRELGDLDVTDRLEERKEPILIIHGTDDKRIPFSSTDSIVSAIAARPKHITFVPINGASHSFSNGYTKVVGNEVKTWVENTLIHTSGLGQVLTEQ